MPRVLIAPETIIGREGPHLDVLREAGFEFEYPADRTFTQGKDATTTIDQLREFDAVLAGGELMTAEVIASLPQLRVIARAGVGYDRVDVDAATVHKVAVTITPTANHEAVAEHALSLLFAVAKRTTIGDRLIREGQWVRDLTLPIRKQTIGIVGLGRIGRSMAVRCKSLGMKVIACESYPNKEFVEQHAIRLMALEELLEVSDFVSLHCPLTPETNGMINADTLKRMKSTSVFLNTARGGLVVERDLIDALTTGVIHAAGLDVFEQEPPNRDNPLLHLDNVVSSPHIAGNDVRSMQDMATEAAQCIALLSKNDWPDGAVVNTELRESWAW